MGGSARPLLVEGRDSPAQRGPRQRKQESPKRVVKLSWGRGVLGNDKWKTRMKSARKKKRDTTYTASSPHPPLLFENLIGKSL